MRQRLVRGGEVDYQVLRSNDQWSDHQARTLVTASLIAWLKPDSVLDPACGDGSIVSRALDHGPIKHVYLNDISAPNIESLQVASGLRLALAGTELSNLPIDQLFLDVGGGVDVIVLTEILEHLDDPDSILSAARRRGRHLVASSPVMRENQVDQNPEHLWMFDREGYETMLAAAGWEPVQYTFMRFQTEYDFGIWVCR